MQAVFATSALLLLAQLGAHDPAVAAERRCGWLINPTPGNLSLKDREAEWTLSQQGAFAAEGLDEMPDIRRQGWVETNRSYGYGCACLVVVVDRSARSIKQVLATQPLPLSRCRTDRALARP